VEPLIRKFEEEKREALSKPVSNIKSIGNGSAVS